METSHSAKESEIVLWLHEKLELNDKVWTSADIGAVIRPDTIDDIHQCFSALPYGIKLKLLIGTLYLSSQEFDSMEENICKIVDLALEDSYTMVQLVAISIKNYITSGKLDLSSDPTVANVTKFLRETAKDLEVFSTFPPTSQSATNRAPVVTQHLSVGHFTLKQNPGTKTSHKGLMKRSVVNSDLVKDGDSKASKTVLDNKLGNLTRKMPDTGRPTALSESATHGRPVEEMQGSSAVVPACTVSGSSATGVKRKKYGEQEHSALVRVGDDHLPESQIVRSMEDQNLQTPQLRVINTVTTVDPSATTGINCIPQRGPPRNVPCTSPMFVPSNLNLSVRDQSVTSYARITHYSSTISSSRTSSSVNIAHVTTAYSDASVVLSDGPRISAVVAETGRLREFQLPCHSQPGGSFHAPTVPNFVHGGVQVQPVPLEPQWWPHAVVRPPRYSPGLAVFPGSFTVLYPQFVQGGAVFPDSQGVLHPQFVSPNLQDVQHCQFMPGNATSGPDGDIYMMPPGPSHNYIPRNVGPSLVPRTIGAVSSAALPSCQPFRPVTKPWPRQRALIPAKVSTRPMKGRAEAQNMLRLNVHIALLIDAQLEKQDNMAVPQYVTEQQEASFDAFLSRVAELSAQLPDQLHTLHQLQALHQLEFFGQLVVRNQDPTDLVFEAFRVAEAYKQDVASHKVQVQATQLSLNEQLSEARAASSCYGYLLRQAQARMLSLRELHAKSESLVRELLYVRHLGPAEPVPSRPAVLSMEQAETLALFSTSSRLSLHDQTLIWEFVSGDNRRPPPGMGHLKRITLSEVARAVPNKKGDGMVSSITETYVELDYQTGEHTFRVQERTEPPQ